MTDTLLRGGRVIDPATGIDRVTDVAITDGRISDVGAGPAHTDAAATIMDVSERLVVPGLVDVSARLREPGSTRKGTIASEGRAALAGGTTTVCCPPDTSPAIDSPATVELIRQRALAADHVRVCPVGALTHGLAGEHLAPMGALARAGCVALGQAHSPVHDSQVLRAALTYATTHGLTVHLPPQDPYLSVGYAHEGGVASRLGLSAIPVAAETAELSRLIELARDTQAHVHVGPLTSRLGVELVRQGQREGVRVTAHTAAHYLHLTDDAIEGFDSRSHVLPPLRGPGDRHALRAAVAEGVIEAVTSDHQPHEADAKRAPFGQSAPGISGLETLLPLTLELATEEVCSLSTAIEAVTAGPARLFGLQAGTLAPGSPADLCVFDPSAKWSLDPETMSSRGRNTPFAQRTLAGRVERAFVGGRCRLQMHQ